MSPARGRTAADPVIAASSKGKRQRAHIVECAEQLFYRNGYDGTSFTDIVDSSGLYRGHINHYFRTKDRILAAVIERRLSAYRSELSRYERENADPTARLLAFCKFIIGRQRELARYGCPIGSLNTELGKGRRELQKTARALFDLFRQWLGQRFVELGHAADADDLAMHLLGRAQGIAVMTQAYEDRQLLERETERLRTWIGSIDAVPADPAAGPASKP